MDTHVDVVLLADRHDSLEPVLHVSLELLLVDAIVEFEEVAELLHRSRVTLAEVARYKALSLDDDILDHGMIELRSSGLLYLVSLSHEVASPLMLLGERSPVGTRSLTLEDVDVEIGKLSPVHVEVVSPVRVVVGEVGTSPVEHRHEVVADALHTLFAEVAEALFVDLNLFVAVGTRIFDSLDNRKRLYDAPSHAETLDVFLQFVDFLLSPHLTQGHIVKSGNDALHTNLSELGKSNLILLAKPTPSSFHFCFFYLGPRLKPRER